MKTSFFLSILLLLGTATASAEPEAVAETAADAPAVEAEKTPAVEVKEPEPSILTFADKSRITGFPKSLDAKKKQILVNSPSLSGDTQLKIKQLLEMTLNGKPEKFESDHYALATIEQHFKDSHRDTIRGRLVNLDDKTITLDTWYAGQLTLQRSMVRSLDIFKQSPSFYTGPDGPEGWVSSDGKLKNSWTFKNRTMISKARSGIARKVEIPDQARISFKVEWRSSVGFRLLFFSEESRQSYMSKGYSLNINQSYTNLRRNSEANRNDDIFTKTIRELRNSESAEFTIYLDRSKDGQNAFYIDGKEIERWSGVDDTIFKGKWLHFIPQSENPTKYSDITIAQWDGTLPVEAKVEKDDKEGGPQPEELEGQKIRLANGDVVIGTVNTITNGMAILTTSFGEIPVPINRMKSVALAKDVDQVKMETGDVRAWFHEGGYITLQLKSLNEKTLKGYSQVWGEAEFDLNAFSRIEFNIWIPKLEASRHDTSADW